MKIDESIIKEELNILLFDIIKLSKLTNNLVDDFIRKCKKKQEKKDESK